MLDIGVPRFEELVGEALDLIPDDLARRMDNVMVVVEEESDSEEPDLLGLYEGVPLTEREDYGVGMVMPDRITIYRKGILAVAVDEADVIDQVRITVIHEVAHHFGIDDDRLDELGWG